MALPRPPADRSAVAGAASGPGRCRLDVLLVQRGLESSRERAQRLILAGRVDVAGRRVDKPGTAVATGAEIEVRGPAEPFASRGGRKLAAALEAFSLDVTGMECLDLGASTGGFTDCLLQRGACRVHAVDVGRGQLLQRLREDERVVVLERTHARDLDRSRVAVDIDLVTVDVSFISLLQVVPFCVPLLAPGGHLLTLIKPQFEAGKGQVGAGGVVRDPGQRRAILDRVIAGLVDQGWELLDQMDSPVHGPAGNVEALALWRRAAPAVPGGAG